MPLPHEETMVASTAAHGTDANEFEPGSIFAGRYKLIEKLGAGGMGVVYKAEDLKLKRLVALKFLSRYLTSHEQAKLRFVQEARAASVLDHQNICTVYEIDANSDGQMYIAMIYYDGETLNKKIERGPLPVEEATEIVRQIAQGLSSAHSKGVIHRDIKPANVILTKDGIVKIVDFGLARLVDQTRLTGTAAVVGTAAYMSPEQAQAKNIDRRTDLWSLGVVFYELLTGKPPFAGENNQAVLFSIVNKSPNPPTELSKDVPEEVERIIFKCLKKNLDDRYESADRLLSDLTRLMTVFESKKGQERIERAQKPEIGKETELRQATVMFIEIAGTSKIMDQIDSEKVATYLDRCFVMFDSIIRKYGGGIDRITGTTLRPYSGPRKRSRMPPRRPLVRRSNYATACTNSIKKKALRFPWIYVSESTPAV
jgi:serine/threonine protein kinase